METSLSLDRIVDLLTRLDQRLLSLERERSRPWGVGVGQTRLPPPPKVFAEQEFPPLAQHTTAQGMISQPPLRSQPVPPLMPSGVREGTNCNAQLVPSKTIEEEFNTLLSTLKATKRTIHFLGLSFKGLNNTQTNRLNHLNTLARKKLTHYI